MFIEYISSKDKNEAKMLLDSSARIKPSQKDELYIQKEHSEYQVIVKVKMPGKTYDEQKWELICEEKGIRAKRKWSIGYGIDILVSVIFGLACIMAVFFSFVKIDDRVFLLWFGLLFLLMFMLFTWKRMFKPSVSLKIFLIRLI